MKIKNLIEILKTQDQELEVGILKNKNAENLLYFRLLTLQLVGGQEMFAFEALDYCEEYIENDNGKCENQCNFCKNDAKNMHHL